MINMKLTSKASDVIYNQLKEHSLEERTDTLVLVIYQYTVRSWSGNYCQDVVQLIPKRQVIEHGDFEKIAEINDTNMQIEVYIEKRLLNQYSSDNIIINAKTRKFYKLQRSMLYLQTKN